MADDEIEKSAAWEVGDLSHRLKISFLVGGYGEDPRFVGRLKHRRHNETAQQ